MVIKQGAPSAIGQTIRGLYGPSIGLALDIIILQNNYWSDTSYSYSPKQVLFCHQL
jgi:hypothetical protein